MQSESASFFAPPEWHLAKIDLVEYMEPQVLIARQQFQRSVANEIDLRLHPFRAMALGAVTFEDRQDLRLDSSRSLSVRWGIHHPKVVIVAARVV